MSEHAPNLGTGTVPVMDSTLFHRLLEVKVNPVLLVNSAIMIIAPFLSWITLNLFGRYESNLWQIYNNQTPLQISQTQASASIVSGALLIAGALIIMRSKRIGLPIQILGFLTFLIPFYSLFGYVRSGFILFLISPGLGMILASVGIAIGLISFRVDPVSIGFAVRRLRTKEGIYQVGLFLATTTIVVDGLNHTALGEAQGFFGQNLIEEFIHFGFLLPIVALALAWSARNRINLGSWRTRIVVIAFIFLAEDATYHYFGGSVLSFIGHTTAEAFLHLAAYYGFALLMISRLFMKE